MGFTDWVLGWRKVLEKPASEPTQYALEALELKGDFEMLAKGTSFRQENIRSLKLGHQILLLVPERGNPHDELAVMVQGIRNGNSVHLGYLPMGSQTQALVHQLGNKLLPIGKVIAIQGTIQQGESGLVVQLEMPGIEQLDRLLVEEHKP